MSEIICCFMFHFYESFITLSGKKHSCSHPNRITFTSKRIFILHIVKYRLSKNKFVFYIKKMNKEQYFCRLILFETVSPLRDFPSLEEHITKKLSCNVL